MALDEPINEDELIEEKGKNLLSKGPLDQSQPIKLILSQHPRVPVIKLTTSSRPLRAVAAIPAFLKFPGGGCDSPPVFLLHDPGKKFTEKI
jgi:hypothetical protein